jgi:hypothetical protein
MSDFETYTCDNCGDEFKAHESANAAENGYCSPKCQTAA